MNAFKTTLLLVLLTVLFLGIGLVLGGQRGMIIAFGLAVVMNFISYWFSDKIVLKMYRAREIQEADNPRLFRIVRHQTQMAELPMPRVYIIPNNSPNAFATGRNPNNAAVATTEGLLSILADDELEGVIGHELAHVKNRDILTGTIAATIAGAISMLAYMARWTAFFGGSGGRENRGGGMAFLVMAIVAPLAAMFIQMAISRSREYAADAEGARISGRPLSLANALRKLHQGLKRQPLKANPSTAHLFIVSPLSGRGLANLFSTHPPVEERIARLEKIAYS